VSVFQTERHFIMQVVCEATQCPDNRVSTAGPGCTVHRGGGVSSDVCVCVQVRVAALQNLVKIMSLYYQYMETYMGPALFAVRFSSFSCCVIAALHRNETRRIKCYGRHII